MRLETLLLSFSQVFIVLLWIVRTYNSKQGSEEEKENKEGKVGK